VRLGCVREEITRTERSTSTLYPVSEVEDSCPRESDCESARATRLLSDGSSQLTKATLVPSDALPALSNLDQALKGMLRSLAEFTSQKKFHQTTPPRGRELAVSIESHQSPARIDSREGDVLTIDNAE
jgi:hypothetical protein